MPSWLRRAGSAILVLALLAFAHQPLFSARFANGDHRTLVEAGEMFVPGASSSGAWNVHGAEGHPLAALSLALSVRLWSDAGSWAHAPAWPLRVENIALVALAAWGLGLLLRRLLWPWTGSEQATAAGWAAALCFALHPFHYASVSSVGARGDLLALAASAFAAALFVKSRQDHRVVLTSVAGVLAILAGLASDLALVLPLVVAVAEFTSARRYRPAHVRLRTAATTLVVFAACVAFDLALRSSVRGEFDVPAGLASLAPTGVADLGSALGHSIERLGVLVLSVNASALGALGFALAGGLVLLALQPALLAARSAPRLWGWLVLAWLTTIAATELFAARARVHPEDVTQAATLLASAAVMCAGLGVASTAVSGLRRTLIPLAIGAGYALLSFFNAGAWRDSAREVEALRRDLEAARETYGLDARLFVLEPPRLVRGVDALEGALPWMLHPIFAERAARADALPFVRTPTLPALLALAREPDFTSLRSEQPLVLVFPSALLGAAASSSARARESILVPKPQPTQGTRTWFREGRSPTLDLEALSARALRVRATSDADTSTPPRVAWRASSALAREGSHAGVWTATGETPEALFDLSSSFAWIVGDRIQRVWPAEGWSRIGEAEVLEELPRIPGDRSPRVSGADWTFAAPSDGAAWSAGAFERSTWSLGLLELSNYEYVELEGRLAPGGELAFQGAAERADRWLRRGSGSVAWSLELRLDGTCIARSLGGRVEAAR